jgi:hypothetical protein
MLSSVQTQETLMKFLIGRSSEGAVSKHPPCPGAVRGPESTVWPGEYPWYVELTSLEELVALLERTGGALGLYTPEDDEPCPVIEIFDDDEYENGH